MRALLLAAGTVSLAAALAPVWSPAAAPSVVAPPPASRELPFVDAVEAWLGERDIEYRAASRDPRETTLVLDNLRLRLLPTPRELEDCLDPGSSARLTDAAEAEVSSLIHLHEDTWRLRGDIVRDRLLNRVGNGVTQRVYARKTTARRVAAEEAIAFLEANHPWGPTKAKYAYGLYLEAELVAVATFTRRRLVKRSSGKRRTHELLRFCARRDMRVVGGITKLIAAFQKDREVDDVVTNIDRDWGGGAGWRAIGFETVEIMPPLPMAIDWTEGRRRFLFGRSVHRLGLPDDLVEELAATADGATERLAARGLHLIHDAGVERLLLQVSASGETTEDLGRPSGRGKTASTGPRTARASRPSWTRRGDSRPTTKSTTTTNATT